MGTKGSCKADGCDKAVRGKGYCDRHYRAWKRGEMPKARYKCCNAEGCRKPSTIRHLCEEHFNATYRKAKPAGASDEGGGADTGAVGQEEAPA